MTVDYENPVILERINRMYVEYKITQTCYNCDHRSALPNDRMEYTKMAQAYAHHALTTSPSCQRMACGACSTLTKGKRHEIRMR